MAPGQPDADCGLVGASHTEVGTRRHAPAGGRPASLRVPPSERTGLYRLVQHHAASFIAHTDAELPQFIKDEFEAFLECGILAPASPRVRCGECGHDKLLAFSCKRRGFCPSCGARRMSLTAAHLVDRVIPHVPVRLRAPLTLPQSGQKAASRDARALVAEMATVLDSTFRREAMRTPALSLAGSMRVQGGGWPRTTSGPGFIQEDESLAWQYGDRAVSRRVPVCGRTTLSRSVAPLVTASRRTVAPVATLAPYVYRRECKDGHKPRSAPMQIKDLHAGCRA